MQETMRSLGYPVAGDDAIAATIGLTLEDGFGELYPGMAEEEMLRCATLYREIFERNRRKLIPAPFPHVKETLCTLKEKGFVLTVASSRQFVSLSGFLRDMDLAQYVSYVLGADNVERAKPDPEPVLKTLRELDFQAGECLVVGDMPVDILMGKRAGATACAVTYGNASREDLIAAGADFIIDSMEELPAQIEKITKQTIS